MPPPPRSTQLAPALTGIKTVMSAYNCPEISAACVLLVFAVL